MMVPTFQCLRLLAVGKVNIDFGSTTVVVIIIIKLYTSAEVTLLICSFCGIDIWPVKYFLCSFAWLYYDF